MNRAPPGLAPNQGTAHCLVENRRVTVQHYLFPNSSRLWVCLSCGTAKVGKVADWGGAATEVIAIPKATKKRRSKARVSPRARAVQDCHYCGVQGSWSQPMTIDHIVPRARGGSNGEFNKQWSCGPCNHRKSDAWPTCACPKCQSAIAWHLAPFIKPERKS